MAEFCVQCAEDLGFEKTDLAGITTREQEAQGLYAKVICEGCGFIQVDHEGRCITDNCLRKHGLDFIPEPHNE